MMMTTGTGRSTAGSATGGGAGGKYPFTQSQWQELEHQALIYKYMAAGMAIPPELLFSIKRNYDSSLSSKLFPYQTSPIGWSPYQMGLGYGGKKIDPEPGRCRRTDGKKWRCSKEAYPDSKYCEKHMHRGKNRSRKPVETTSTLTTNSTVGNNNNSLLANSYNSANNPSSIVSPSSLMSSSPITNKNHQHHHAASSSSSNSSSTFHSLSSFSPVGLAADTNNSLHYGRPTDHHHQQQHGSSYDVANAHFLYPHSSSARPPGSSLDLSNQDNSSVHLLFDSGAAASFSRDRYAHVMKDDVGGVGGEHAFFSDNSSSMRGFAGTSWGNPQQQQDPNHNLLKMGVAAAHSSMDNTKQGGGGYSTYHLELNKASEITKQQDKQQQLYVWGRDFGSDQPLKMGDSRDHHHQNPNEANDKTIHHFFDEWPPKEGGNGGGRGGGRDPSSPWHDASTTQLSISMPTPSHDFFLSSSARAHNES